MTSSALPTTLVVSATTVVLARSRRWRIKASLSGGTASFAASYAQLTADVGIATRRTQTNSEMQDQLLDDALARRDSVSGVNLDEEAANLLRFQQAYQAAAQVIATANTLFDTLLGVLRR